MNKILPIILVVVLSGCGLFQKSIKENIHNIVKDIKKDSVYLPSGNIGYTVSCHYNQGDECFYIMGEVCKRDGYEIIDKRDKTDPWGFVLNTHYLISCNE